MNKRFIIFVFITLISVSLVVGLDENIIFLGFWED